MKRHPSSSLLLFGATGDLAKRMLLPSLYALHEDELLAADLRIVGTARSELSDEEFRALAKEALQRVFLNLKGPVIVANDLLQFDKVPGGRRQSLG